MGRKSVSWRRDPEVLARLATVEQRHLEGRTNVEIAAELGIVEGTVRNDLKRIQTIWIERLGPSIEQLKAESVAFYRQIQREALDAFHGTPDKSLNRSAYLNTAKSSEDSIIVVLGIKAPEKVENSGTQKYVLEYVNNWRAASDSALPPPRAEDRQDSGETA